MESDDVFVVEDDYLTSIDNYTFRNDSEDDSEVENTSAADEVSGNEVSENQNVVYASGDYTDVLTNIQNSLYISNASMVACILLIGILMGLKKL